jgi:hypothetical protein
LGLEVVIEPSPRPLAWAIESRPFGPQNAGICVLLREAYGNSETSKASA